MHLASISALLTILALTIDPFIQQAVLYTPLNVPIDTGTGNASTAFLSRWKDPQQTTQARLPSASNPSHSILGPSTMAS